MTTTVQTTSAEELVHRNLNDPRFFIENILGVQAYDKQIEIMESVRDRRRVSVVGCNGSGKDWTAARTLLWWMCTYYPAKAIVTGPTHRQVDAIVWNEIRNAYRNANVTFGGRMFDTPRYHLDEQHFAVGFSTGDEFHLQGFHSPNLLVIVTEAHSVSTEEMNALRRLNPKCILMTGNAFVNQGDFFDSHHSRRDIWNPIKISAFDLPNVKAKKVLIPGMMTYEDVLERRTEWGEDSPMYEGSVLANFVESMEDAVIGMTAVNSSIYRDAEAYGNVILGVDVARFGKDKTVVVKRQGDVAEIIWETQGKDLMAIAGWVARYCTDNDVSTVVVDDTGLGGGVTDRLHEVLPVQNIEPFKAGGKADRATEFGNKTTETWFAMKDWIESTGKLPDSQELAAQLISRKYVIRSDRTLVLESKTKMSQSPDQADALAMTFADVAGEGVW
jgi:phage terminase large subunit